MGKPILLTVDDEPTNQMLLKKLFSEDFEVHTAGSGLEAVDKAQALNPAVILMDVIMPVMDGYEACAEIRKQPEISAPILFLSSHDEAEDKLKGYEAGGDDFISKPFSRRELKVKVMQALETRNTREELASRLASSSQVAMEAMSYSGELGSVLDFFEQSLDMTDLKQLVGMLFKITQNLGLKASLAVRNKVEVVEFSDSGEISPLESNVINLLKDQGRIYAFGKRIIFNYSNFSMLIKNMPVEDENRCGRLRDVLATLANGLEARINAIGQQRRSENQQLVLLDAIKSSLGEMDESYAEIGHQSLRHLEDMRSEIEKVFDELGLTDQDELKISGIIKNCHQKIEQEYKKSLLMDMYLKELKDKMQAIFQLD